MLINMFPSDEKGILRLFKKIDIFKSGFEKMILNSNGSINGAVYGYEQSIKQADRHRLKSTTSIKNYIL